MRSRPSFMLAFAAMLAAIFCATDARAQTAPYPDRIVHLVVPFPAGGATDVVARLVADWLTRAWKQQVIVENMTGASGAIGTSRVARSAPDGYTLLVATSTTNTILPTVRTHLNFDPIQSFDAISMVSTFPNMLVIRNEIPAHNVAELIELMKKNPEKYSFASSGAGSSLHLAGELFMLMSGTKMLHVPFSGGSEVLTAILGGHVDMMFNVITSVWPAAQSGEVRALGVGSPQRTPLAPEVPAIAETLPGFDVTSWAGIMAPAGTPAPIKQMIAAEIAKMVKDPETVQKMHKLGADPISNTPDEFSAFIKKDYEKWRRLVTDANIKVN